MGEVKGPGEGAFEISAKPIEPEGRLDDVDEAHRRANISNGLRNEVEGLDASVVIEKEKSKNPPEFEPSYAPLQRKLTIESSESTAQALRDNAKKVEDTGEPVPGSYKYE